MPIMSTRKSTPKRKRQESASRIIDDVSKRLKAEENRLSPESEQIGETLLDNAKKLFAGENVDESLLDKSWQGFVKQLIERKN